MENRECSTWWFFCCLWRSSACHLTHNDGARVFNGPIEGSMSFYWCSLPPHFAWTGVLSMQWSGNKTVLALQSRYLSLWVFNCIRVSFTSTYHSRVPKPHEWLRQWYDSKQMSSVHLWKVTAQSRSLEFLSWTMVIIACFTKIKFTQAHYMP